MERLSLSQLKTKSFLRKKATQSLKDVHLAGLQEKPTAQEAADAKVAAGAGMATAKDRNTKLSAPAVDVTQRFLLSQKPTDPCTALLATGVRWSLG
ncbi:hypothetical protein tpqmel_0124 [Candidatus Gastranaerophilus sp. (ex Termes propinquus)]|nr:hypothetical protein tpqmel_0124 [Candidatus Gastranaerophilus sp. (ex Termes propinquus)]